MALKGSGESFAQISAEKANPKLDLWFGGTGDPHLQAAELGLTEEYRSPLLAQLQPWAQKQAEQSKYRTVGLYLGVLGIGYNTELLRRRSSPVAGVLEGSRQAGVRGRGADGEPERIGHRVYGDRDARPGVRRGRGVQVPQGAAQEHQHLSALGHGADQGRRARRDDRQRLVHPRRRHRGAGRLPGQGGGAVRRHRLRDRLDVDRQGRAQPRQRQEILRLGADAEGAGAGGAGEAVPDPVERRHAGVAAVAEDRRHQAHQLRLREVRPVGRAQAAARALGPRGRHRSRNEPGHSWSDSLDEPSGRPVLPPAASRTRSSTCTAARPTPRGARAWRSASRRRPAPRSRSCRRRPAKCWRRSRPSAPIPKGDIWWAGAADNYLQAAEDGLLEEYRSPNVGAALRLGAADHRRVEEPRGRRLRRHPRARLQHRNRRQEEAAGAQVLEGPDQSGAARARSCSAIRIRRAPPT